MCRCTRSPSDGTIMFTTWISLPSGSGTQVNTVNFNSYIRFWSRQWRIQVRSRWWFEILGFCIGVLFSYSLGLGPKCLLTVKNSFGGFEPRNPQKYAHGSRLCLRIVEMVLSVHIPKADQQYPEALRFLASIVVESIVVVHHLSVICIRGLQ